MRGFKRTSLKTLMIAGTALVTFSSVAMAQVEQATGVADPSRVTQDLLDANKNLPTLSQSVEVKDASPLAAPSGAENITFVLQNLMIDGVGAYTAEDLAPVYRDMLGTKVSLADVYALANKLTTKYRNEGYILTQVIVPPQTIENGTVKLRAVEGFVNRITVQGVESESEKKRILEYAGNLKEDGILDAKQLEKYLLLINDLPGVTARSILSPSKTVVGASDLTIVVERDRYEGEVGFDNHGSRYLGPYQASFSNSLNSVFRHNELITTQVVISGDKHEADELAFGAVSYELPISRYGTLLQMLASYTATEPGDDLDQFDVKGHSQYARVGVTHPFVRSRTMNLFGRAQFDLRDVESKNDLEATNREDRIRSIRLGGTLQFMDTMFGVGINAVDFEYSQGVGFLGASNHGQANLTRAKGDPNYKKAKIQVQRLQRLTSTLNLLAAGAAQLSANPLLSSEEFGVGGTDIGRGYDSSEIVGDDGIAGKLELQWNKPYEIQYISDYQLFTYLDSGTVWNKDATTSAGKRQSIASAGIGFTADITEQTEAGLGVAWPLTRNVDATGDTDPRYYFSLKHKF